MLMEPRASRAFLVDLGIDPIKFLKNGAVFQRVINESASEFRKCCGRFWITETRDPVDTFAASAD